MTDKPPYRVPPLADILTTPYNGLTHISTFSGAGGTCLGFRLAGFKTLLANDCDPRAIACYRANLQSPIDERPIQQLSAAEIFRLTGLKQGELDVFEGSPPCTSFSTAGNRAKDWGKTKEHAGVVQQKIEDLFFDWLKTLDALRPRAFAAENVAGMVKGVAKGYFKLVLAEMKRLGYRTAAQLLDAQWLGVPQQRQRVIFIGIRDDVGRAPAFPVPLSYRYTIRDALPWIDGVEGHHFGDVRDTAHAPIMTITRDSKQQRLVARVMHDTKGQHGSKGNVTDAPAPAIVVGGTGGGQSNQFAVEHHGAHRRKFTMLEVKRLCSFPDDYDLEPAGAYAHQWARLGNSVPPLMAYAIASALRDRLLER